MAVADSDSYPAEPSKCSMNLHKYQLISLSIYPTIRLTLLSIYPSIYKFICLSLFLYMPIYNSQFIHLTISFIRLIHNIFISSSTNQPTKLSTSLYPYAGMYSFILFYLLISLSLSSLLHFGQEPCRGWRQKHWPGKL